MSNLTHFFRDNLEFSPSAPATRAARRANVRAQYENESSPELPRRQPLRDHTRANTHGPPSEDELEDDDDNEDLAPFPQLLPFNIFQNNELPPPPSSPSNIASQSEYEPTASEPSTDDEDVFIQRRPQIIRPQRGNIPPRQFGRAPGKKGLKPYIESRTLPKANIGAMNVACSHCSALHWKGERITSSSERDPRFTMCCLNGKVSLLINPI
jgi:hypothetical protein